MTLVPTSPDADFLVTDFQTADPELAPADTSLLALLRTLANRLICEPGKALRPLTDLTRELCQADAAGICLERDGELVAAETLRIVVASGTCAGLSGAEVPRPQSACAIAMDENRPKFFQVSAAWLPIAAAPNALAHGITVPWTAGETRGTLWVLRHTVAAAFTDAQYRTLLTLATLAGIACSNLCEQQNWRQQVYRSTSDLLTHTLSQHIQQPLHAIQSDLNQALNIADGNTRTQCLRTADALRHLSARVDELLTLQLRTM